MKTEKWVPIPGYTGYEISNLGNARSYWRRVGLPGSTFEKWGWRVTAEPKALKHSLTAKGYHVTRIQVSCGNQKLAPVHRIMLEAFVGARPSRRHHACHIDDNKDRNVLDNLEWGTPERNLQSRFINHGGMKLDAKKIQAIRAMLSCCRNQTKVAKVFGVTQGHVSRIQSNKAWHYA